MSTNSLQKKHWLVHVARRTGLPGAESLELEPGTPTAEAWLQVADTLGINQDQLAEYVGDYFRLKVTSLETAESSATKLVPEKIARQYQIFPVREDDRQLVVATSDPTNFAAEQALGFISGRKAVFEVSPPPFILEAINAAYSSDGVIEALLSRVDAAIPDSITVVTEGNNQEVVTEEDARAAPVIKLTNLILRDAAQNGASDIHIEPGANGGTVRFRIDGVLRNYMQLPLPALVRVISRIKILGNLDIADKWRPQDGRTRILVEGRPYDIRISTVPTREAEKAVLRLLKGGEAQKLTEIGLGDYELVRLRELLAFRDGIVCVTGPTGSGKTTTLYAGIREMATGEVNIMTVEDPVEYELAGITQIQVQPKRGVTFASALRAILRQDPDVILVGEIRDLETAGVAVQAAMTGHMVLATVHTNDAVSTIARLVDLGLDRASIASTVRGSIAQRLVRKLCDECAEPIRGEMTEDEIRLAKMFNVRPAMRAVGCRRCADTGYRGRIPLQEVFIITSEIADMITEAAPQSDIYKAALKEGMRPLLQVGLERVRNGETTLEELERVLGMDADDKQREERRAARAARRDDEEPEPAETPRRRGAVARAPEPDRVVEDAGTEESADLDAAPHVLVVDDDPEDRLLVRTILRKQGYRVSEAEDGDEALDLIAKHGTFSLIVLDLEMPRMDGRVVLERLRSAVSTAGLPVVVLTGSTNPEDEYQLMENGADDYLRKPIDPPRFMARVKAALRRARTS
ncbi:MAG TPA: ATPase, T2SS/T4P/T4SS family [Longimicrobiales bacterium]|nr:ATPase, T2SS/T4P/T4SS family [Longimicrobiales bacterium]